ncbi:hypothetical protein C8J57DRAFT_1459543 [Mycena rebaudengoi]|nr:hypothetical protein C8J57DRAFT_1459543 [Mycena rebaudengoi]
MSVTRRPWARRNSFTSGESKTKVGNVQVSGRIYAAAEQPSKRVTVEQMRSGVRGSAREECRAPTSPWNRQEAAQRPFGIERRVVGVVGRTGCERTARVLPPQLRVALVDYPGDARSYIASGCCLRLDARARGRIRAATAPRNHAARGTMKAPEPGGLVQSQGAEMRRVACTVPEGSSFANQRGRRPLRHCGTAARMYVEALAGGETQVEVPGVRVALALETPAARTAITLPSADAAVVRLAWSLDCEDGIAGPVRSRQCCGCRHKASGRDARDVGEQREPSRIVRLPGTRAAQRTCPHEPGCEAIIAERTNKTQAGRRLHEVGEVRIETSGAVALGLTRDVHMHNNSEKRLTPVNIKTRTQETCDPGDCASQTYRDKNVARRLQFHITAPIQIYCPG